MSCSSTLLACSLLAFALPGSLVAQARPASDLCRGTPFTFDLSYDRSIWTALTSNGVKTVAARE
jgi:hypothetical protein